MPLDPNANGAQTLLIDADDTLWENNIYFERAIAGFISFLNHHEYSPARVRGVLNEVERECIITHGYGLHSFAHALVGTFEKLAVEPLTPALHETLNGFAHAIAEHPVEIIAGVPDTLDYLAERHHLILMTKGAIAEQSGKVERSGLKDYFSAIEIVEKKTPRPIDLSLRNTRSRTIPRGWSETAQNQISILRSRPALTLFSCLIVTPGSWSMKNSALRRRRLAFCW